MRKLGAWAAILWLLVLVDVARADENAFTVKAWTTRTSAFAPEIHLLIENWTDDEYELSVELIDEWGCPLLGRNEAYGEHVLGVPATFPSSRGVLTPNGWLHRSTAIALGRPEKDCQVRYRVEFKKPGSEDAEVTGWFRFAGVTTESIGFGEWRSSPDDLEQGEPGWVSGLEIRSMVETTNLFPNGLIVRTWIRNTSEHGARFAITDRMIECPFPRKTRWALFGGVRQGEDVGPVWLAPGKDHVFVAVIAGADERSQGACRAIQELSQMSDGRWIQVENMKTPLAPTGRHVDDTTTSASSFVRSPPIGLKPQ